MKTCLTGPTGGNFVEKKHIFVFGQVPLSRGRPAGALDLLTGIYSPLHIFHYGLQILSIPREIMRESLSRSRQSKDLKLLHRSYTSDFFQLSAKKNIRC